MIRSNGRVKLSEYIREKLMQRVMETGLPPPESKIERWITDWYQETYGRLPPSWLAERRH